MTTTTDAHRSVEATAPTQTPIAPFENASNGDIEQAKRSIYPPPSKPMAVARRLIADEFTTDDQLHTLTYWRGEFWTWDTSSWKRVGNVLNVKKHLWDRLETVDYLKDDDLVPWEPSTNRVQGLMEPVKITVLADDDADAPAWINQYTPAPDYPHPSQLIPLRNGQLDRRNMKLYPHTPHIFNTWALDFDYNPEAKCPSWGKFLDEVFAHDPDAKELLQEFFGYVLSGRLDLQKALIIIGVPRSGKGTISRTLKHLAGVMNSVSPSLSTLGGEFGLSNLIGKPLAIIEDARADEDRRNNITVERLLNIIGQDAVSVNIKNKDYWQGTLPTRFMLISNEVPRFLDASGAILTRFMSIKLTRSFEGNEDPELGDRINDELPGIFNWALEGLKRLEDNGTFTTPATMAELHEQMHDLASPVSTFLDERYIITGNEQDYLTVSDVHTSFKVWCEQQGYKAPNRDTFTARLTAAAPLVTYKNTSVDGLSKARRYFGLRKKNNF